MSCALEFPELSVRIDFFSQGNKQNILIDILIRHGGMDVNELASVLGVSVKRLYHICDGHGFLVGEKSDTLVQLFLMFLGKNFFKKCKLIRDFM
jgi:hypothetical protein